MNIQVNDTEKLEKSREIGRDMAIAYADTPTRTAAINQVRAKHDVLSYADAELMWMAVDSYVDFNG